MYLENYGFVVVLIASGGGFDLIVGMGTAWHVGHSRVVKGNTGEKPAST